MSGDAAHALGDTRLGLIGAGAMGEAMLAGLVDRHIIDPAGVTASHPRHERRDALASAHGVTVTDDNSAAAREADVLLLAVKPQMLPGVMAELRGRLRDDQLVISVIAGASTRALGEGLDHRAVVRTMPNTPSQIGQGVTVWYATEAVDERGRDRVKAMLGALGREFEVHDERQVAMATAVSGTGPTYIFLFIEALIDAAVHLGFPRHVARELVLDTMSGSANFALQSGKHVAELRDMVVSPGGTSADALYQMEKGRFRTVVSDAVWAAFERTLQLEARLEGGEPPGSPRGRR